MISTVGNKTMLCSSSLCLYLSPAWIICLASFSAACAQIKQKVCATCCLFKPTPCEDTVNSLIYLWYFRPARECTAAFIPCFKRRVRCRPTCELAAALLGAPPPFVKALALVSPPLWPLRLGTWRLHRASSSRKSSLGIHSGEWGPCRRTCD